MFAAFASQESCRENSAQCFGQFVASLHHSCLKVVLQNTQAESL